VWHLGLSQPPKADDDVPFVEEHARPRRQDLLRPLQRNVGLFCHLVDAYRLALDEQAIGLHRDQGIGGIESWHRSGN